MKGDEEGVRGKMRDDAEGMEEGTFSVYGESCGEDQSGKGGKQPDTTALAHDSVKSGDTYSNLLEKGFLKATTQRIIPVKNHRREHVSPIIPSLRDTLH